MNKTKIEYLDLTWNPLVGCEGFRCAVREVCWARAMAKRRKHECSECYRFIPHIHHERLDEPFKRKKPSRIGVAFMGDLFDSALTKADRLMVWNAIEKAYWHTYFILTKQPQNISDDVLFMRNVWLGVSVNRGEDLWRIRELQHKHCRRFVSFEPLYEDLYNNEAFTIQRMNWVIIGAQTRPTFQPLNSWVLKLTEQAHALNIPVFMKNNMNYLAPVQEYPKELLLRG